MAINLFPSSSHNRIRFYSIIIWFINNRIGCYLKLDFFSIVTIVNAIGNSFTMSMSYDSNSWLEDDYEPVKVANGQDIKPDTIIGGNFKTLEKLGSGSFGQIFLGQNIDGRSPKIYKLLHGKDDQVIGFPKVFWFGQWFRYNVLVIELLGKNLDEVFQSCGQNFTIKTILYLVLQLLNRFEFIHSKNIAYRDVKPENFLLGYPGLANRNIVHVVDFGLSKEFIDPHTGQHIPFREGKNLTGTARYMSINAHFGIEQSRRDDLESLGHLFMYFLRKGKLPWSGLKASTLKERYRKIGHIKQTTPPENLSEDLYDLTNNPDYDEWKKNFGNLFRKYNDGVKYEWEGKIV
ncbi:Casein kinase I isoform gamma-2 [Dermatophagoides farinae]|uniref:non-specific serine/threonine protein kinase n=1 Tax=Dermatophagoides farinae TaxID=6954 RepID=A0A922ICE6_DERFA|nr:Casein kinase I isoform gamma-2 [Dermatophagoides farinae]